MHILDRYILVAFIKNYLISLFVLIGLYILLDLVFNFDEFVEVQTRATTGSASFFSILYVISDYYFYQSFFIFSELSGVIPVAATAFTLVRFARFNELSPIMAAGIPLLRFSAPIMIAAAVMSVVVIADQEILIPKLIPKLTRKHDEVALGTAPKAIDIQDMQDGKNGLLFASRYIPPTADAPAQMYDIDILERDDNAQPVAHIIADRADYDDATKSWKLLKGQRVTGLRPRDKRTVRNISTYHSDVTPEEIALFRSGNYVNLLSTARIDQLLQRPKIYGVVSLLRVKHTRVTQCIMNLVLVALAIGVILTREPGKLKTNGLKLLVVIGIVMSVVFVCGLLAERPPPGDQWIDRWPALMAWLPIFLFGPLSIFLLDRLNTKKS